MKLTEFPVPQRGAGETLTSVVARHLARSAAPRTLLLDMIGLTKASPSAVIQRNFSQLASIMPPGHPWENAPEVIVRGHTLVPLFLHFADPDRGAAAVDTVISGHSRNPTLSLGITANVSRKDKHTGKFCPDCLADDLNSLGYTSFYRQHQPAFVKMCAVHSRPLHLNCLCQNAPRGVRRWQMAGRCECSAPHSPPVLGTSFDAKAEQAWLWLSNQVATILTKSDLVPRVHVAANLLAALQRGGFASKSTRGLARDTLIEALFDWFGEAFLAQLGIASWIERPGWSPAGMLIHSVTHGGRIPSVLRMLLLARLVTEDIASLWNPVILEPTLTRDYVPRGYGGRSATKRTRVDREAIASALDAANGMISAAAKQLGVQPHELASDMRYHGMSLALSPFVSKRLGATRIAAVRDALAHGVPKNKIYRRYNVSPSTLLLIEIDRPELSKAHREATVASQREKHRNVLLSLLRDGTREPRRMLEKRHGGSAKWLRRFDRKWFNMHLPEDGRGRTKRKREFRKDWHQLDKKAAMAVRHTAAEELGNPGRPILLSRSRLLFAAGVSFTRSQRDHYPTAVAEAERLSETREECVRRTIRWAVQKCAKQYAVISMNQLYKVVGMPKSRLVEYHPFIIEVAAELELSIGARSQLARGPYDASYDPVLLS